MDPVSHQFRIFRLLKVPTTIRILKCSQQPKSLSLSRDFLWSMLLARSREWWGPYHGEPPLQPLGLAVRHYRQIVRGYGQARYQVVIHGTIKTGLAASTRRRPFKKPDTIDSCGKLTINQLRVPDTTLRGVYNGDSARCT
jgi:hypothetical protein